MNLSKKQKVEIAKISDILREVLPAQPEEYRQLIGQALRRAERLSERIAGVPAKLGAKRGRKTAERGSDWFRKLAAMRTTKAGGRPKKSHS